MTRLSPAVLDGDKGNLLLCIVERLLLAEPCAFQRNSIFRTRCTIKQYVCDVILENGSCENFVFKVMVKSLSLTTVKHPNPYKLAWIQKRAKSMVSEACKVPFFIGNTYAEDVVCDVVEMDAWMLVTFSWGTLGSLTETLCIGARPIHVLLIGMVEIS